jgi:hypothetical protein
MNGREELAAAADDDQRRRELRIGREREAPLGVGARGAALVDDGDLRARDGLAFGTEEARLVRECAGREKKRQRGSEATDAEAETDAGSTSRGITSVSIALRMCFAMRLM